LDLLGFIWFYSSESRLFKGLQRIQIAFLFSRLLRFRYAPTVWLGSPPSFIDGRGWLHSFDSHCTRHSGVGQEIVEKGSWLPRPFGVSGWMIYGAEAFLLAYATWGLEQWRPSLANRRAPGDPGPLRSPCCCGALRRTDCGFDCQGCGANLAIRDGVLIVRATPTGDNKIRGRLLPQPALADGPVLGAGVLDLERRRERGARRGFAAPAEVPRPPSARRHRRWRLYELAPPGLVYCRRRYLHDPARRLPAPELRPQSAARLKRS
jgi:hypothetical protein